MPSGNSKNARTKKAKPGCHRCTEIEAARSAAGRDPGPAGPEPQYWSAVAAIEAVDECLGDVVAAVHGEGGACVVTADHGNADEMLEEDGSPDTAHSLNPVPFVVTAKGVRLDGEGILADVAPTLLALLGIERPAAMTGRSLLG